MSATLSVSSPLYRRSRLPLYLKIDVLNPFNSQIVCSSSIDGGTFFNE